jgi:hypothetical protein
MAQLGNTLSLEEVARRLDNAKVAWAVFAGAAATAYGVTRQVTDIDILVPVAEGTRVATLFPEAEVKRGKSGPVEWIRLPDFDILPGLTYLDLDAEMVARLGRHEIFGVTIPVISPEDNILIKALLGRGPEVGKHDWEDVEAMMAYLPSLDWEYLHWRINTCVPKERAEQVLQRIEAVWQQAGKSESFRSTHLESS